MVFTWTHPLLTSCPTLFSSHTGAYTHAHTCLPPSVFRERPGAAADPTTTSVRGPGSELTAGLAPSRKRGAENLGSGQGPLQGGVTLPDHLLNATHLCRPKARRVTHSQRRGPRSLPGRPWTQARRRGTRALSAALSNCDSGSGRNRESVHHHGDRCPAWGSPRLPVLHTQNPATPQCPRLQ